MYSLGSLRIKNYVLNSTETVINVSVAITDYLFKFSESAVANIVFPGEPIFGVRLEPDFATIAINGWFIKTITIMNS